MQNNIRKVGKVHSWVELMIYFLLPLILILVFNLDLFDEGIVPSNQDGTKPEIGTGYLAYNLNANIFTLLGFLIFIALMLERFIEVLINTTRKPDLIKYEATTRSHKQNLEFLEKKSADVKIILEELNKLNGKIEGMKVQESSMQSRSLSYSAKEQPMADDKISQIEGDLANCKERKRELSLIVDETFRPLLKQGVKKLHSSREENGKTPLPLKVKAKLEGKRENLEELEKEFRINEENPSIILANILRVNREIMEHDRAIVNHIKAVSASYKVETRIIAIRLAFGLGILISLVGFRTAEALVVSIEDLSPIQSLFFIWTDVLLTGGVIAGGSEGIHKIANVYGNFMDSTSNRLEQSAG